MKRFRRAGNGYAGQPTLSMYIYFLINHASPQGYVYGLRVFNSASFIRANILDTVVGDRAQPVRADLDYSASAKVAKNMSVTTKLSGIFVTPRMLARLRHCCGVSGDCATPVHSLIRFPTPITS